MTEQKLAKIGMESDKKSRSETSKDSLTDGHSANEQHSDDSFSQTPIGKLPVECLVHIFSFLSIFDRIRIQRVSNLWRDVSLKSWLSLKTLGFAGEDWGLNYLQYSDRRIDQTVFEKVLKLCGTHVTRIDFPGYYDHGRKILTADQSLFKSIEHFCPNLTAIDIRCITVTVQGLECLAKSNLNLTEFAIDTRDFISYPKIIVEPLSLLFKNKQNLRRVIFHVLYAESCLLDLNPVAIEEISVMYVQIDKESFYSALNRFTNLRILHITDWYNCCSFDDIDDYIYMYGHYNISYINDMLKSIEPHSENLKELQIRSKYVFEIHFQCLGNLQKLCLRCEGLDIDLLAVTEYCTKLTYVSLSGLQVADYEIISIMRLPEIRELYLCCLDDITDIIFFDYMSPLKILHCYQCPKLTNFGFLNLVQSSNKNLQRLTITDCENVDLDELIQAAGTDIGSTLKIRSY